MHGSLSWRLHKCILWFECSERGHLHFMNWLDLLVATLLSIWTYTLQTSILSCFFWIEIGRLLKSRRTLVYKVIHQADFFLTWAELYRYWHATSLNWWISDPLLWCVPQNIFFTILKGRTQIESYSVDYRIVINRFAIFRPNISKAWYAL